MSRSKTKPDGGNAFVPSFSTYCGSLLSMVKVTGGTTVERPTPSVTVMARMCFPSLVTAFVMSNVAPSSVVATVYGRLASTTCSAIVTSFAVIELSFGEMTVTAGGMGSTEKWTGGAGGVPPGATAGTGRGGVPRPVT